MLETAANSPSAQETPPQTPPPRVGCAQSRTAFRETRRASIPPHRPGRFRDRDRRGTAGAGRGPGRAGDAARCRIAQARRRSEEHTSELQSLMRNPYAVFCLKKKTNTVFTAQRQRYADNQTIYAN